MGYAGRMAHSTSIRESPGTHVCTISGELRTRFGNYLEFAYDHDPQGLGNRLQRVFVNSAARALTFAYDNQGRIVSIKDYKRDQQGDLGRRTWRYTYDDYGDLIAFTTPATDDYPAGLTERYGYSTPYYTGEPQHRLTQVYDTAGRLYLENTYGTDTGLFSFNRVVLQREGHGERFFEYEDVSLATGLPAGQPDIEEDMPAHQTVMVRRNGHPVHYIYNKFGNLLAREEDAWVSRTRRRLVTHYRYNRDGAPIGEISPEVRVSQYYYGRDEFLRRHHVEDLNEEQLHSHHKLDWMQRLSFGNRLAIIQRAQRPKIYLSFQFPNPLADLAAVSGEDIVVKFTYEPKYQHLSSISDPRFTKSPYPNHSDDQNPGFLTTLTRLHYDPVTSKFLERITYPDCKRNGVRGIEEKFLAYDVRGRLTDYEDRAGTRTQLVYFGVADLSDPHGVKEGYLCKQIVDPAHPQLNPAGLNLVTHYEVNDVGTVTQITLPKSQVIHFDVDNFNRVTRVTRTLPARIDKDPVTGLLKAKPKVDYDHYR